MLVTLEGLDGCGKTTIWRALHDHYPDAVFTREPTETWYGKAVRRSVRSEDADSLAELFLYCADHAAHVSNTIKPHLDQEKLIISDRYIDSRLAYQSVTLSDRFKDPHDYISRLHEPFTIMPTLTLYLDVEVETALARSGQTSKFESRSFLTAVAQRYRNLIANDPDRFVVIDANRQIDAVKRDVIDTIDEHRQDS